MDDLLIYTVEIGVVEMKAEDWVDVSFGDIQERLFVYDDHSVDAVRPDNALSVTTIFIEAEDGYNFYAG